MPVQLRPLLGEQGVVDGYVDLGDPQADQVLDAVYDVAAHGLGNLRDGPAPALGGDNRRKPDKVLEAVRFVARQIREHGSRPSWRKLLESWNRTHPDRRYESHNALVKAFERFVHPKYNRPKYKPREPTPYQRWRMEQARRDAAEFGEHGSPKPGEKKS